MSLGKSSQVRTWLLENDWLELVEVEGRMAVQLRSPDEQFGCSRSPDEQERSPHEQAFHGPPPIKRSPHEQKLNIPNEVGTLETFFTSTAGIFPGRGNYKEDWQAPLKIMLERAGSVDAAKDVITRSVEFARAGTNGRKYTIASPRSIATIAANLADENKALEVTAV